MKPSRRSDVASFIAMDVLARANAMEAGGADILHLEVGQPGAPAPQCVRDAAAAALRDDRLGYTDALGRKSLRARIARHYGEVYAIDLDPERVVVTTGCPVLSSYNSSRIAICFFMALEMIRPRSSSD